MTTTTVRPARVKASNITGEIVCRHRNQSCCSECFSRTPGLIDVAGCVYRFYPADWVGTDLSDPMLKVSPGTVPSPGPALREQDAIRAERWSS